MTNDDLDPALAAFEGQTIHVLDAGGLNVLLRPETEGGYGFPVTANLRRGDELVLTRDILAASLDRFGQSWLLVSDLSAEPRWGFGPFPATEQVLIRGSEDALYQADQERALAWRTKSGPALAEALRDIDRRLGRTGTHSTTLRTDGREAIEQHEADAAAQRRLQRAELERQSAQNTAAANAIQYGGDAA